MDIILKIMILGEILMKKKDHVYEEDPNKDYVHSHQDESEMRYIFFKSFEFYYPSFESV